MKGVGDYRVLFKDLTLMAKVGCIAGERDFAQRISLDLSVEFSTAQPPAKLTIEDTVDYAKVRDALGQMVRERSWLLLEQLAEDSCELLFTRFAAISQVSLTARKYVFSDASWVAVEVTRKR